jgi:carboxypeptidase Taq
MRMGAEATRMAEPPAAARGHMEERFAKLREELAQIDDLGRAARVLGWDQQTMMPRGGAAARADQLATLERIAHERFTSPEIGALLEELRPYEESLDPESTEASLIRVARRDYEKAVRVPPSLRAEMARSASVAQEAWLEARAKSDFGLFLPHLQRNLELKHRYVECFEPADEPYDILLDDYEEGMTTAEVRAIFARLKERLVPLIATVAKDGGEIDDSMLTGDYPVERQKEIERAILTAFGFDESSWRIDPAPHPFATSFAITDIRLTTRYFPDNINSLFASMHECGHGLYEFGSSPELERTPLAGGVSLGLHESQSRLWENLVGRSRPFWRRFYPELQQAFPAPLGAVDMEAFYRAINRVRPSLIRVEADEVTYNLHVILRFELEQDFLHGRVELRDLPGIWNARMHEYLGVEVPRDAEGVLQDIHWSAGIVGYFPTYSLGNIISVQVWNAAREALPELEEQIEAGEFAPLREWLREHLHRHGRKFTPRETLARVVGGPIDPEPYLAYLEGKVSDVYGLAPAGG